MHPIGAGCRNANNLARRGKGLVEMNYRPCVERVVADLDRVEANGRPIVAIFGLL